MADERVEILIEGVDRLTPATQSAIGGLNALSAAAGRTNAILAAMARNMGVQGAAIERSFANVAQGTYTANTVLSQMGRTAPQSMGAIASAIDETTKATDKGDIKTRQYTNAWHGVGRAGRSFVVDLQAMTRMMLLFQVGMAGLALVNAPAIIGVAATKMAADFERAMLNVNSIAHLTDQELSKLGQGILDLSTKFPQSANTIAKAMYDIYSAGLEGERAIEILTVATQAASAGLTDVATAARPITAIMLAWGESAYSAERTADILFKAVERGVFTFADLSQAMGEAVPMAAALDRPLEEVAAALALATQRGLDINQAAVSIGRLYEAITTPTPDALKLIKALGLGFDEWTLKEKGLARVLEDVRNKTGGNIQALEKLFGDIRAGRLALTLMKGGLEALRDEEQRLIDSAGARARADAIQKKGMTYNFTIFKNIVSAGLIALGGQWEPTLIKPLLLVNEHLKAIGSDGVANWMKFATAIAASTALIIVPLGGVATTLAGILGLLGASGLAFQNWGQGQMASGAASKFTREQLEAQKKALEDQIGAIGSNVDAQESLYRQLQAVTEAIGLQEMASKKAAETRTAMLLKARQIIKPWTALKPMAPGIDDELEGIKKRVQDLIDELYGGKKAADAMSQSTQRLGQTLQRLADMKFPGERELADTLFILDMRAKQLQLTLLGLQGPADEALWPLQDRARELEIQLLRLQGPAEQALAPLEEQARRLQQQITELELAGAKRGEGPKELSLDLWRYGVAGAETELDALNKQLEAVNKQIELIRLRSQGAVAPLELELAGVNNQLRIMQLTAERATVPLQRQIEAATRQAEAARIQGELTYEPQRRMIERLLEPTLERLEQMENEVETQILLKQASSDSERQMILQYAALKNLTSAYRDMSLQERLDALFSIDPATRENVEAAAKAAGLQVSHVETLVGPGPGSVMGLHEKWLLVVDATGQWVAKLAEGQTLLQNMPLPAGFEAVVPNVTGPAATPKMPTIPPPALAAAGLPPVLPQAFLEHLVGIQASANPAKNPNLLAQWQVWLKALPQMAGAMQFGGEVYPGRPYLVGEAGPEIFMPRAAGTIVPNGQSIANNTDNRSVSITIVNPSGPSVVDRFMADPRTKEHFRPRRRF